MSVRLNFSSNLSSDVGFLYCDDNEKQEEFLDNESLRDVLQVKYNYCNLIAR